METSFPPFIFLFLVFIRTQAESEEQEEEVRLETGYDDQCTQPRRLFDWNMFVAHFIIKSNGERNRCVCVCVWLSDGLSLSTTYEVVARMAVIIN